MSAPKVQIDGRTYYPGVWATAFEGVPGPVSAALSESETAAATDDPFDMVGPDSWGIVKEDGRVFRYGEHVTTIEIPEEAKP